MELRDLGVFVTVVEAGGMTRAAERLHLVQSAVSQAVKRLEQAADLQLLERRRSGVRPTQAGSALVRHARLILASVAAAERDLAAFHGLHQGEVHVGMLHSALPLALPPLLRAVSAAHPGLQMRVREAMLDELLDLLTMRLLDLAVIFLPAELPALEVRRLGDVELAVVTSPEHHAATRRRIQLEALADERWISFPRDNPGRVWLGDACARAGFAPDAVVEVETLSHVKTFVEAGAGIALIPPGVCEPERRLGSLRTLKLMPSPHVTLAYVVDPQRPPSPALDAVRQLLEAAVPAET